MSPTLNALPNAVLVKQSTQESHMEVERLLLPKLTSIQTTDDYASILKMFYGYYKPVEDAIASYIDADDLPDIAERRNAASVLNDLDGLGHSAEAPALCQMLPEIGSRAQAFGALYVLEGSTLGGKMIAKMLAKNPAIPQGTTRFFTGYGEHTGSKWKGFLEAFNQQEDAEAMVASANDTFSNLKGWMQQTHQHDRNQKL